MATNLGEWKLNYICLMFVEFNSKRNMRTRRSTLRCPAAGNNNIYNNIIRSAFLYFSALQNETQKILCDFEIQTDHQTQARRPDLLLVNKK